MQGNIYLNNTSSIVGNIIYSHGIITLTTASAAGSVNLYDYFITGSDVTMSFESTYTIHETQYKCTARENEFNFTQNPTVISGSARAFNTAFWCSKTLFCCVKNSIPG